MLRQKASLPRKNYETLPFRNGFCWGAFPRFWDLKQPHKVDRNHFPAEGRVSLGRFRGLVEGSFPFFDFGKINEKLQRLLKLPRQNFLLENFATPSEKGNFIETKLLHKRV